MRTDVSPREIWFENDGVRLHAIEAGTGRPIVLLHGGLADHRACYVFAAPLVQRFRLITPDLRGAGRSHHHGPLGWDDLADDVAALLDHLDLERAVVGGVSFGSGCALRFALRHPDRTAGLILLSPVYPGADAGLLPAQETAMQAMAAAGRQALTGGMAALHPLFDALPAAIRPRALAMVDSFDPRSVAATTAFMACGDQPLATAAELGAIAAPTLIVPGSDPEHPPEIAHRYARHLRRRVVREASGDEVTGAIADFVADGAG